MKVWRVWNDTRVSSWLNFHFWVIDDGDTEIDVVSFV